MFRFGEKHPVIFELILIVLAFIGAGVLTAVGRIINLQADLSTSLARIAVAVLFYIVFRKAFRDNRFLPVSFLMIPALLFPAWNLFYNLSSGSQIGGSVFFLEGAITALAPALFEEVIFRGIFLYNLKKKGHTDMACMVISAVIFAVIHLTNAVGQDLVSVALQVGYSLVVGLVLAAIYLRNRSLSEVILIHFLTDFTNRIYIEPATAASWTQIGVFAAVLVVDAAYAFFLMRGKQRG